MSTSSGHLPPRPDRVLRVAFAGNRSLPDDPALLSNLEDAIYNSLRTMARWLVEIGADPANRHREPEDLRVADFYSPATPVIRLVTGLAEGADDLAARALARATKDISTVRWELAAVLGFDHDSYRKSRDNAHRPRFDDLYQEAAYVVEADGIYDRKHQPTRARGHRAQSTLLLRQADVFIAMADLTAPGRAGGTMETIHAAQQFRLPLLFIDATNAQRYFIAPEDNASAILSGWTAPNRLAGEEVKRTIRRARRQLVHIIADPDISSPDLDSKRDTAIPPLQQNYGPRLLAEFFDHHDLPPRGLTGKRRYGLREWLWTRFERLFKWGDWKLPRDEPLEPYKAYRARATSLNYHYAGLYRGAFMLNYGLAVVAVFLAALSLVLIGGGHSNLVDFFTANAGGHDQHDSGGHHSALLLFVLGLLGALKLTVVIFIYKNTHRANKEDWNERAIDYRYLAERLRSLFYLPGCGSFQPPAASAPQFASRAVRQSAIDWLVDAIVRHVSPATLCPQPEAEPSPDSAPDSGPSPAVCPQPCVLRPDPAGALATIRNHWLAGQIVYHRNTSKRSRRIYHTLESLGKRLNFVVIGVVIIDLLIIGAELLHLLEPLGLLTPWLVFLAGVLPAAVAGINGIRFQSECRRLAERSAVMAKILRARGRASKRLANDIAASDPTAGPGAWTPEVLHIAEGCAGDLVEEVAEWSVLYAKQLPET